MPRTDEAPSVFGAIDGELISFRCDTARSLPRFAGATFGEAFCVEAFFVVAFCEAFCVVAFFSAPGLLAFFAAVLRRDDGLARLVPDFVAAFFAVALVLAMGRSSVK
jgi:hypothetical protein